MWLHGTADTLRKSCEINVIMVGKKRLRTCFYLAKLDAIVQNSIIYILSRYFVWKDFLNADDIAESTNEEYITLETLFCISS